MSLAQAVRFDEAPWLHVAARHGSGGTVITLRGEADVFTRPVLVAALVAAVADHDGPVFVDLAHTDFIDAGGVRVLARAARHLENRGRTLTLRSPSRTAARVIEAFGMSSRCETVAAAS